MLIGMEAVVQVGGGLAALLLVQKKNPHAWIGALVFKVRELCIGSTSVRCVMR